MYTKQEASGIRQAFWTTFGQYLSPIPGAGGTRINWVNYKTGLRDVYIKMDATDMEANIAIVLTHKERERQFALYNKLFIMKPELEMTLMEEWIWDRDAYQEGRMVCRIYINLPGVSIFKKGDWPRMITFLKDRIIRLDSFWFNKKELLEMWLEC